MTQVAARCGAEVVFTEVHVEGRELVGTIAAPSDASAGVADAIIKDFMEFVRERAEARHGQRRAA